MKLANRLFRIHLLILPCLVWSSATGESAKRTFKGEWQNWEVRTIGEAPEIPPVPPAKLSKFGGYTGAWRSEASGHFRTESRDGRWWFIDPLGYPFISMGVNSVALSHFSDEQVVATET